MRLKHAAEVLEFLGLSSACFCDMDTGSVNGLATAKITAISNTASARGAIKLSSFYAESQFVEW